MRHHSPGAGPGDRDAVEDAWVLLQAMAGKWEAIEQDGDALS